MRRLYLYILITFMMFLATDLYSKDKNSSNDNYESNRLGLVLRDENLNLTDSQKLKIENLYKEHRVVSKKNREEFRILNTEYENLFDSSKFNSQRLRTFNTKKANLIQKNVDNRIEFIISIIEILDENQKKYFIPKVKNLLGSRSHKRHGDDKK